MPTDVPTLVLVAAAVLAGVLLVGWLRTRAARRPDRSMTQFQEALGALRPDAEPGTSNPGASAGGADDPRDEVTTTGREA